MRIQTLIVKGIIAGACLLVPSEVLANGNGKPDELPGPPTEVDDQADEKQNENASGKTKEEDQQKGNSKENTELPTQAKTGVDRSEEEKGKPEHANLDRKRKAVDGKGVSEVKKEASKPSQETVKSGTPVHIDRGKNQDPLKDVTSFSDQTDQMIEQKSLKQKRNSDMSPKVRSSDKAENEQASRNDRQPMPHDESPADSPAVIPTQTGQQFSKQHKTNDGSSNSSGNGFVLYGLSFTGEGTLVTLGRDFLNEHRREHNQWINAPPSPPPKSNLLTQSA